MSSARTYRQRVNNGPVARRNTTVAGRSAGKSPAMTAARRRPGRVDPADGLVVILIIILVGGAITWFTLTALNYQFKVDRIGIAEATLKQQIHHLSNAQRIEVAEHQRALSDAEKMALSDAGLTLAPVPAAPRSTPKGAGSAPGSDDLLSEKSWSAPPSAGREMARPGGDRKRSGYPAGTALRKAQPNSESGRVGTLLIAKRDRKSGRDDR